jgi:alkylation response protein AidB-like acyl-CoA dehydrogenase
MNAVDREKQIKQAEEILGGPAKESGFAKGLFFGEYRHESLLPYPVREPDARVPILVDQLRFFCREQVDPVAIDRNAEIPQSVIDGLGRLGILGACLPPSVGGLGLTQSSYCRILEVLGGHCGSTALFVNAHHSIGPRALVLFGTPEQQALYLPKLATGESISAFALTEPQAGSDAANVQSTATPTADGKGFILNGEKRWITNGGIADALTVMARTPDPKGGESKITAFVVTPDMPGFSVVEKRMSKMGVRGTATSRLAFKDLYVPRENVLGQLGKGLRVALTVLDYGRTTFGASCTGAAKFCVAGAVAHVQQRVQFGEPLANFELVKQKLAFMEAATFAMEACTYQTAALMDSGHGDFMLETAMLKVFSTELLWTVLNDTFQLHGGLAYFTDQPWERMVRDARINTIGEGANDVLRGFSALVGMRDVGLELESVLHAIYNPLGKLTKLARFGGRKVSSLLTSPAVPVRSAELEPDAHRLGAQVGALGAAVERLLIKHQKEIVDRQYQLARIADVATDLYASTCVLNRMDYLIREHHGDEAPLRRQLETGRYWLLLSQRRVRGWLASLSDNDDAACTSLAKRMLRQ